MFYRKSPTFTSGALIITNLNKYHEKQNVVCQEKRYMSMNPMIRRTIAAAR
jgi:hypothetical protein